MIKKAYRSSCTLPAILVTFELNLSFLGFSWNVVTIHENPSSGSRVVLGGRMNRHDEANSLLFCSKFCEKRLKIRAAVPHLPRASLWREAYLSVVGKFIPIFPLLDTVYGNNTFRMYSRETSLLNDACQISNSIPQSLRSSGTWRRVIE